MYDASCQIYLNKADFAAAGFWCLAAEGSKACYTPMTHLLYGQQEYDQVIDYAGRCILSGTDTNVALYRRGRAYEQLSMRFSGRT